MKDSDARDWAIFRDGEDQAFERIYRRHRDHIYSFCFYASGDEEVSADVVQEAFVRLLKQKECPDNVRNWLFITARNVLWTTLQQDRRRKEPISRIVDGQAGLSAEQKLMIEQVLKCLNNEERELILLKEYGGFSTIELGASLQISPEAVRVRLCRIRKKLQAAYKDNK